MGSGPLVSVIIPAYNGKKTIEHALTSVVRQVYRPLEIIVIDDCSKDGTKDIVKRFCKRDQRIRLIENRKNLGLAATLNHGCSLAGGHFIMIIHQDCELLRKDWIDRTLALMNSDKKTAVVTGFPVYPIDELNGYEKMFIVIRNQVPDIVHCEEIPFSEFKCDLIRKEALIDAGRFSSQNFRISGEDQVLSYKLRKLGLKIMRFKELKYVLRMDQDCLLKNLKKEHVFGKTQAGIFLYTSMGPLQHGTESRNAMRRTVNRAMALFTFYTWLLMLPLLFVLGNLNVITIGLLALFIRFLQYAYRSLTYKRIFHLSWGRALLIPPLGLLSDFIYGVGFSMGLMLTILGRRL